ncbi:MAG TPA: hypothetical protein VJS38_05270 [Phenylobacterium sp.]|uniref:hypothetical protein n=1 Tax=Phenylobacterium sp. TaxID=1871053 RepID=UPI002B487D8E|nr:hypothetical protein [Phenylobacterium sp.]HKR87565.1 hypothetical protein [Phenylobacterium sp.]
MLRKSLALAVVALACMAAAPKPAARPAKPAAAAPAAHAGPLDARDPAALVGLLASLSAKAEIARRDGDAVFLTVTSPTEVFSAQFAGCDAQGGACQALLFDRQGGGQGSPTLAQVNAFNQTSVMCRLYQDKGGRAHVLYSSLLFPKDGRAEMLMHLNAWRGCIGDFNAFLKDPTGFLAGAA